jgi:hypothetical protein
MGMDVLAAVLIVSRRPEAITNPQFFAEDGHVFYEQAYTLGWQSLLTPYSGYFLLVPRLVAWASLLAPLRWAPLIFALAALVIQVTPVVYWLSVRCTACIPDLRLRILLAILWVALPVSWETTLRLYDAEWHLNMLAFLVVVAASPARTRRTAAVDAVLVGLAVLTAPAVALLLPLGLVRWWREGRLNLKWDVSRIPLLVLALGALTQAAGYVLVGRHTRVQAPIGATPDRIARMAVNHVFLPDVIGGRLTFFVQVAHSPTPLLIVLLAVCGTIPLIAALWRGPLPLRLLILYGLGIAALALSFPTTTGIWLAAPLEGDRYFIVLQVAWLIALLWVTTTHGRGTRLLRDIVVTMLAFTVLVAIPVDWRAAADPDLHFASYATRFAHLPPGASIAIPINPVATTSNHEEDWTLHLTRR